MSKVGHYAVIGRIPFDDEDSCYIYDNVTRDEAVDQFEADIYEDSGRDDQEETTEREGSAVYISHVLFSESEIKLD
jgi:hypothetical protein